MGQSVSRLDVRWDYRGKGPLVMESKTYVGNDYKGKERHGVARRGKIVTDLPIRIYLAGD